MKVGDTIRIAGYGGTWTVTAIAAFRNGCPNCNRRRHRIADAARLCQWFYPPSSRKCTCGKRCRRVFAQATEGTRITARECRCEVV